MCNLINETFAMVPADKQPDHGKTHIKSVDELKVGMKVGIRYRKKTWNSDVTITKITNTKIFYKEERSSYYFLDDKGMKPYKTGWNRTNWIERL